MLVMNTWATEEKIFNLFYIMKEIKVDYFILFAIHPAS